ncbi:MAG: glycosyltransferase family 2 protein [Hyphomonas sp.]|uniref:glycosyltransferase family 2 protein n=1 Tax=Hyphomonas sp. TaxID=87 RepID=UPI00352981AB
MIAQENALMNDNAPVSLLPSMVLAVIPALNEERHIEACIRSLMQGEADLRRVLLVVADGGSSDGTVAVVNGLMDEFPNLRLIDNPKRLQSAAMNLAVEQFATAGMRYVVRCDAHSIYPGGFILKVARALDHTRAASVVVPMDATGETCFEKANAWIVDTPLGSGGSAHRGGRKSHYVDHGHHAGFDLSIYRKIGGYDESFSHNEDAEYDERVAQEGGRIFLDADIRIAYVPRGSVKALARQYFNYGKGRARNVRKHGKRLKPRQAAPIVALLASLGGLAAAPFFLPALILPVGYLGVLCLASLAVTAWKRSACGLLAGLASGVMHMSWAAGFLKETFFPLSRA